MRRLIAAVVVVAAALATPLVAAGGATTSTDTFVEQTNFFQGPDVCTGVNTTGTGTQTVTVTVVETSNGGVHVRTEVVGSVDFYQALGPGPWDPQPGAYVGTWTYRGTGTDQAPPNQWGATDGTAHGVFTFADGRTAMRTSEFHLTWGADGPKLFFAHFACGGA
jgi:hypothetical protein